MSRYEATVNVIDKKKLQEIADEFYDGDFEMAVRGEMISLRDSGIEIDIKYKKGEI